MTGPCEAKLEVLPDPEVLARRVADWMLGVATAKDGAIAVALSGGSTPRRLYERLAEPRYRDAFPWSRAHWFWGDERFVPHDHPESNYRMVREAMLSRVPVPEANIHPITTENVTPEAAAAIYERELMSFYGADRLDAGRPLFDLILLGLGADGHTASLFPGTSTLDVRDRWVVPVADARWGTRVTLTYPTLESGRRVAFLVAGEEKRAILSQLRHGNSEPPAARLHPVDELFWFVDEAAAGVEA